MPVNVLALPNGPTVAELGIRRRAAGLDRRLAGAAAYGALLEGARELLADGTSTYTARVAVGEAFKAAFEPPR